MKRVLPSLIAGICSFASWGQVDLAHADEPDALHRYEDDSLPTGATQTKLILGGLATTTAFYLPVLGASYLWPDHRGASDMRIPVVGPWLAVGRTDLCSDTPDVPNCSDFIRIIGAVLLVLDGIGQAGGIGLTLEGIFMHTSSQEATTRNDTQASMPSPLSYRQGDFQVTPVPVVGGNSDLGLAFVGHF